MRNFQLFDTAEVDNERGIITLYAQDNDLLRLSMRHEGSYLAISASYGAVEIALRPRFAEVTRTLSRLRPVSNRQTTRQVGTGQAYLSLGLQSDGTLVMRPTIVADATGHIALNLVLTEELCRTVFNWLPVPEVNLNREEVTV